jgi:transcriptional regulator with XRE-family HTH domain
MKRPAEYHAMTADELRAALKKLGWTQAEFGRRTGMSPDAVSRWCMGDVKPPPWAAAYLEAMLALAALHERFLSPRKAEPDA